jgi:hypothetical protein
LVANGYSQKEETFHDITFSLAAKMNTVRIMIALSANYILGLHQMDAKLAFLNHELKQEVYLLRDIYHRNLK